MRVRQWAAALAFGVAYMLCLHRAHAQDQPARAVFYAPVSTDADAKTAVELFDGGKRLATLRSGQFFSLSVLPEERHVFSAMAMESQRRSEIWPRFELNDIRYFRVGFDRGELSISEVSCETAREAMKDSEAVGATNALPLSLLFLRCRG